MSSIMGYLLGLEKEKRPFQVACLRKLTFLQDYLTDWQEVDFRRSLSSLPPLLSELAVYADGRVADDRVLSPEGTEVESFHLAVPLRCGGGFGTRRA